MFQFEGEPPPKPLSFEEEMRMLIARLNMGIEEARDELESIYGPGDWRAGELLGPLSDVMGWLRKLGPEDNYEIEVATQFLNKWMSSIDDLANVTQAARGWGWKKLDAGQDISGMDPTAPWEDFSKDETPMDTPETHNTVGRSSNHGVTTSAKNPVQYPSSITVKGQNFALAEVRPYTKQSGEITQILTWRSQCQKCGADYEFTSPSVIDRSKFILSCQLHRAKRAGS